MRQNFAVTATAFMLIAMPGAGLAQSEAARTDRPRISSEADLPPTRFPTPELPSAFVMGDAFLMEALPAYRAEAERLLADYDIEDPTIASNLRSGLTSIAWLQGRGEDALRLVAEQRAAETKPQLKQISQLFGEATAVALSAPSEQRCAVAAEQVSRTLAAAEPLTIRDQVLQQYGIMQVVSPAYHIASAALLADPQAKAQGSIGIQAAMGLARIRYQAVAYPACRAEVISALRAWIANPAHQPTDIWPARSATPQDLEGAKPVVAAVWESGFDPDLFADQIAIDPAEPLDGLDNDGNGVIDDAYGPTFDQFSHPTRQRMAPASPLLAARLALQMVLAKGARDLGYGDDTPEARLVAERSREASLEEQMADIRVEREFGGWAHATWVASLIADGAPFVRLYALNIYPYNDAPDPVVFDEDDARREVALLPGAAERLRGAGVRLVNMSWVSTADGYAEDLLRAGGETDPARAAARGAVIDDILREGIDTLIRDCPDILFIAGAGNTDQTEAGSRSTPQTFDRPNLLVVGGAGVSGLPTAFTTYGNGVRLYALAEGNRVRAPGGQVMRSSGTSFAAPMAVRAAAGMLAVNPGLKPTSVIEGLLATSGPAGASALPLLNEGAAVRWARARR